MGKGKNRQLAYVDIASGEALLVSRLTCLVDLPPHQAEEKCVRVSRAKRRASKRQKAAEAEAEVPVEVASPATSSASSMSMSSSSSSSSAGSMSSTEFATLEPEGHRRQPKSLALDMQRSYNRRHSKRSNQTLHAASLPLFGPDGLRHIDITLQLFMLDKSMKTLRYCLADRDQRKLLTQVAKAYKLTIRCIGNGELRAVDFMKTRSTDKNALLQRQEIEHVMGLRCGDSFSAAEALAEEMVPLPVETKHRYRRFQNNAPSPATGTASNALEMQYQALLDAGETAFFEATRVTHLEVVESFPFTADAPETLHARLVRAEAYLRQFRDNKHTLQSRKDRIPVTREQFYINAESAQA